MSDGAKTRGIDPVLRAEFDFEVRLSSECLEYDQPKTHPVSRYVTLWGTAVLAFRYAITVFSRMDFQLNAIEAFSDKMDVNIEFSAKKLGRFP